MRPSTKFIQDTFGKLPLVGAEIGVLAGTNAKSLLENLNIKWLILVDLWDSYIQEGKEIKETTQYYDKVTETFGHLSKVCILKERSVAASKRIDEHSLDFVYIDACHDYLSVKEDIDCWFPKVKSGGVISGHDYGTKRWPGVTKAVDEFVKSKLLFLNTGKIVRRRSPKAVSDWFIVKE